MEYQLNGSSIRARTYVDGFGVEVEIATVDARRRENCRLLVCAANHAEALATAATRLDKFYTWDADYPDEEKPEYLPMHFDGDTIEEALKAMHAALAAYRGMP